MCVKVMWSKELFIDFFNSHSFTDAILLLILDEEVDVFYLIVDAMTVFISNEEIQIYGCKSLQLLLEKGKFKNERNI